MDNFLFTGGFWGGMLILAGILIILNGFFHLHIPAFRIIVAVFFVALGISILSGGFNFHSHAEGNSIIFGSGTLSAEDSRNNEYSIVFGRGLIDLSNIVPDKGVVNIRVSTAFGSGIVEISRDIKVKIRASAAFGDIRLPDDTFVSFGHNDYESENLGGSDNYLLIDASAAFGNLKIMRKSLH